MHNKAAVASVKEMESLPYRKFIRQIGRNVFPSKDWEYPWLWFNGLQSADYPILDIGSASSPIPRYMARGGSVTMVETDRSFTKDWVRHQVDTPNLNWVIVDNERLPFESSSFGCVTSFSVVEHQKNKKLAISEIVRVLKPGGTLAISFDICDMGMTYPNNGDTCLTLSEFESLIWFHPAFGNIEKPEWNLEDIPSFLSWHKTTAPHHTYICGAAILRKHV